MKFEKDYVRRKISSNYRSLKESDSNATLRLEDIKEDEIDLEGRVDTLEQEHADSHDVTSKIRLIRWDKHDRNSLK